MSDYEEYKTEFLESLRADSAISGSTPWMSFLLGPWGCLSIMMRFEDPQRIGCGDKRCSGNHIMRADGYCF